MSRSRQPRANNHGDADEELKRIWSQIRAEAKKIDAMITRSAAIGNEIVEIEQQQAADLDLDKPSDAALDSRLEELYRENVRLSEQITHMIEGNSDETNLLENIRILQALREAAEESATAGSIRSASQNGHSKGRASMAKRKAGTNGSAFDDGDESTIQSPRGSGRLTAGPGREKGRGGSAAPSMREASVKIEDGESIAGSIDNGDVTSKAGSEAGNLSTISTRDLKVPGSATSATASPLTPTAQQRQALVPGAMVFYRNKGRTSEGEGILCKITSVIGEGKQRRYEIQDADPDPQPGTGEIPAPYRASVSHLYAIPSTNAQPDLPKGKNVLAQYPDTTTFYKAEVSTPWRQKDLVGEEGPLVRLRFEGEMEEAKETEVERRFVVPDPPTK